ncbi:MAG: hypothetical protein MJ175_02950 [Clostridia bacterium]|nr:hypothetical protein [Clostridia bacterium]
MKKENRAALALAAATLLSLAVSCGEAGQTPQTTEPVKQTAPVEAETEAAVIPAINSIGSLADLDFGGQEITIDISVNSEEWNTSAVYIMGASEEIGDVAKDMVYRRNMEVADALNVKVNWIETDLGYTNVLKYIQKPVLAGDSNADLYINDQYGLVRCLTSGVLYDVASMPAESNYFDFSAKGWFKEYMDELSILPGKQYFLVGEYFMDVLRGTHVMYFNKNLITEMYEGSDDLYNTVFDGKWTYDVLLDYMKDAYRDLNGDGSRDRQDLYGVRAHTAWGNLYFNTTGCRTVSKDSDGNLVLNPSVDRLSVLADKIIEVYSSPGYCVMDSEGTAERINYFVNGQVLFDVWLKIADLETDEMRNMDGIGMLPYPKLDEQQDGYRSLVHDIAEISAIPVTVKEDHLPALSAYLQAMTQYTDEHIMPAYFETALKIKYSQDEQSAKVLDILREGIRCPFEYAYTEYFSAIGYDALSSSINKKTNVVASSIEKGMSSAQKKLDKLLDALDALG